MSRGFDGFEIDDFRDSRRRLNPTAVVENQAEDAAAARNRRPASE